MSYGKQVTFQPIAYVTLSDEKINKLRSYWGGRT